jgi:basic amino acid/polyamine antiporter, APA family
MTELKRVLGLPTVTFIAIGFTIGAGVFVFTEIVLKIAGQALPVAYALAVIPVVIIMMPIAMLGSAIPCTGASYKYPSRMVSPRIAFTGIWIYILSSFFGVIPLYAISCAKYASAFMPGLNLEITAIVLITLFFIINILGIEFAAWVQGILVIVHIVALIYYAIMGYGHFHAENFVNLFQKGPSNLLLGSALLTFTYLGANGIIELGGEMKDPSKTIPRALFITYPIALIIYLMVAIATVGAMPISELLTLKDPLVVVSKLTSGQMGFLFFVIGGAILSILGALNALFIVGTKSLLIIISDNIFPEFLGAVNKRFRTAHILLTIIWVFSILGIVCRFPMETLASYAALASMVIFVPVLIASMRLPKMYPEEYAAPGFRLKGFWLWLCPVIGFLMVAFFSLSIIVDLKSIYKIGFFLLFAASGLLYYEWRRHALKKRSIDLDAIKGMKDLHV